MEGAIVIIIVIAILYFIFTTNSEDHTSKDESSGVRYHKGKDGRTYKIDLPHKGKKNLTEQEKEENRRAFYKSFYIPEHQFEVMDTLLKVPKPIGRQSDLEKKVYKKESSVKKAVEYERKSYWKQIESILEQYDVDCLYHFTDRSNLPSINTHGGLYSWQYLERNGIAIPKPGGNNLSRTLDERRELGNYVRLSFKKSTPMLYRAISDGRIGEYLILEINPDVMFFKKTLFADGNATAVRCNIGGEYSDFQKIRFDILDKDRWHDEEEKFYWQAEVLVHQQIPSIFIKNIS